MKMARTSITRHLETLRQTHQEYEASANRYASSDRAIDFIVERDRARINVINSVLIACDEFVLLQSFEQIYDEIVTIRSLDPKVDSVVCLLSFTDNPRNPAHLAYPLVGWEL